MVSVQDDVMELILYLQEVVCIWMYHLWQLNKREILCTQD